jgi:hypothetical protein
MYEFYNDVLQPGYKDNIEILAIDTDSFVLNIKTEDLYEDFANRTSFATTKLDLAELNHRFNFSNYPKNHPFNHPTNLKFLIK